MSRATLRGWLAERAPELWLRWGPGIDRLDDHELGRLGEALTARALTRAGWRLLGRRLATPHGEVDLVAAASTELVCVEVKTGRRRGPAERDDLRWRPGWRLRHEQLERLRRAGRWLAGRVDRGRLQGGRVDLVEVLARPRPARWELLHHADLSRPIDP